MPRAFLTSQRIFPVVIAITLAVSVLPPGVMKWFFHPIAEFQGVLLGPFAQFGNYVGGWLRPAVVTSDTTDMQELRQEMEKFRQLYIREQSRVRDLQGIIEQLQRATFPGSTAKFNPLWAPIGLRSPFSGLGQVTLNRGSSNGVTPGTVAVYNGVQLVGQVKSDISSVQCALLPLANKDTGMLSVRAVPKGGDGTLPGGTTFQIEPVGDGTFLGEPDNSLVISAGEDVLLFDQNWPETAQGMVVGVVESVSGSDAKPLRQRVIVRPTLQVAQLHQVLLKIETDEPGGSAGNGAGNGGGGKGRSGKP